MGLGALGLLFVGAALTTAASGGWFMVRYRSRRATTRWIGIPVPISLDMWIAAAVLAVAEVCVVVSIVLLVRKRPALWVAAAGLVLSIVLFAVGTALVNGAAPGGTLF